MKVRKNGKMYKIRDFGMDYRVISYHLKALDYNTKKKEKGMCMSQDLKKFQYLVKKKNSKVKIR